MIYGERVRLRAVERSDLPTFVRWFNDPEVRQYLDIYEPISTEGEEQWFEDLQKRQDVRVYALEARVGEEWVHIGNIGLHRIRWKDRNAVLGIAIGEKEYWGKGYGADAIRTILRFAFEEMNLHRVELEVIDFNHRARRCYEKVGFRYEGTRRQAVFRNGAYHDLIVMSILRDEFRSESP